MSQALPDVREAPERPVPPSEARDQALTAVAEDFHEQINPGATGTTVGDALAAADPPAAEAPADEMPEAEPQEEEPQPEPLDLGAEDEELNSWLDEPEPEDISEEELLAAAPADEQTDEFGYTEGDEDPRVLEERRRRIAAEKKAQHYESLRAQDARKEWKAEALKAFPLSEHVLDEIQETSRKGFLRAARAEHQRVKPYIDRYVERASGTITAEAEQIIRDTRDEAQRQFGRPTTGPGTAPIQAAQKEEILEAARREVQRTGDLKPLMKAMMEVGE